MVSKANAGKCDQWKANNQSHAVEKCVSSVARYALFLTNCYALRETKASIITFDTDLYSGKQNFLLRMGSNWVGFQTSFNSVKKIYCFSNTSLYTLDVLLTFLCVDICILIS